MAYTVDTRSNTPANVLRDALAGAERGVVSVNPGSVESLLLLFDNIEQLFEDLEALQVDLRPEEGRWRGLTSRVMSQPQPIVAAARGVGGMRALREKHPPAAAPWWHLDEVLARRRRQMAIRLAVGIVAIVAGVSGLVWAVNTFFPPNPETILMVDTTSQIDRLVQEGRWEEAMAVVEETRKTLPHETELLLWESVLAERLGDADRAESRLAEAVETTAMDPVLLWVMVGNLRMQVGDLEGAEVAAQKAHALDETAPEAVFLMANLAELKGDRLGAIDLYNEAFDLAEQDDPQLAVIAKVRMGQLLQQVDPFAGFETPTPESSESP